MFLLLSIPLTAATTQYTLGSVETKDVVRVQSVTDTRFMSANDNAISSMKLLLTVDAPVVTLNISNPDSTVVFTFLKSDAGLFKKLIETNIKTYSSGSLVSNESSSRIYHALFGGTNWESISIDGDSVISGDLSAEAGLLPSNEITISTSSSTRVDLTVVDMGSLQKIAIQDDLNWLFSFIYSLLTIVYSDPDNGLLSFLYLFSFVMDATLAVLWLTFTNTYLVVVWIEAIISFYAGWRNNKIKGFVDNMVKWHLGLLKGILYITKELFTIVHDVIKSILPGYG